MAFRKAKRKPMKSGFAGQYPLKRYAWLSIAAALTTIALKFGAYLLTDSVGLLSDSLEATVNLLAAGLALAVLGVAARPADEEHAYGYSKAEYFSSGAEGTMILIAAIGIAIAAVRRFIEPRPLEQVGLGIVAALSASLVNWAVATVLASAGKRHRSITLEADARHLMTDVWTSAGVLAGVSVTAWTGWNRLDPIVALLVAGNILRSGVSIVRRSVLGLLDTALPSEEQKRLRAILGAYHESGIQIHALRTRQAGARRFVSMHVVVPGSWTVHRGHQLLERLEAEILRSIAGVTAFTHLESLEDPTSWDDVALDREGSGNSAPGNGGP